MRVKKLHDRGNHLIFDSYAEGDLSDIENIKSILEDLTSEIKMKAISEPLVVFHESDNIKEDGVTGVIIIAESSITIHTYPNKNWFSLDVYSCKEFNIDKVIEFLKVRLKITDYKIKLLKRGFYDEED